MLEQFLICQLTMRSGQKLRVVNMQARKEEHQYQPLKALNAAIISFFCLQVNIYMYI